MDNIKISVCGDSFCFFDDEDAFVGKMGPTQMLLFYVAYKLNGIAEQSILDTYCEALKITPEQLRTILLVLQVKFDYLLKYKNIDFTQINLNTLFEKYSPDVLITRLPFLWRISAFASANIAMQNPTARTFLSRG